MPRPRKSRLQPALAVVCEELIGQMATHLQAALSQQREELGRELGALRRQVAQLSKRVARDSAGAAKVGRPRSERTCAVEGCTLVHIARGLCKNHYQQMRYVERKAASGVTVKRRRSSGELAPILEAATPAPPSEPLAQDEVPPLRKRRTVFGAPPTAET
jgi:hypothetical protein